MSSNDPGLPHVAAADTRRDVVSSIVHRPRQPPAQASSQAPIQQRLPLPTPVRPARVAHFDPSLPDDHHVHTHTLRTATPIPDAQTPIPPESESAPAAASATAASSARTHAGPNHLPHESDGEMDGEMDDDMYEEMYAPRDGPRGDYITEPPAPEPPMSIEYARAMAMLRHENPSQRDALVQSFLEYIKSVPTRADSPARLWPNERIQGSPRDQIAPLDYAALEYVDGYDENLECPICRSPFYQPSMIECHHIFCANCLRQSYASGSRRCPIDRRFIRPRSATHIQRAPPVVCNLVDALLVRCPNAHCKTVLPRADIERHYVRDCPETAVRCRQPGCSERAPRAVVGESDACPHLPVPCPDCGATITRAARRDHGDTACTAHQRVCARCDERVAEGNYEAHQTTCPLRDTACEYKAAGCTTVLPLPDMDAHRSVCLYAVVRRMEQVQRTQMQQMATALQDAQNRVRQLQAAQAAKDSVFASDPDPAAVSVPAVPDVLPPVPAITAVFDHAGTFQLRNTLPPQADAAPAHEPSEREQIDTLLAYAETLHRQVEHLETYVHSTISRHSVAVRDVRSAQEELRQHLSHLSMNVHALTEQSHAAMYSNHAQVRPHQGAYGGFVPFQFPAAPRPLFPQHGPHNFPAPTPMPYDLAPDFNARINQIRNSMLADMHAREHGETTTATNTNASAASTTNVGASDTSSASLPTIVNLGPPPADLANVAARRDTHAQRGPSRSSNTNRVHL